MRMSTLGLTFYNNEREKKFWKGKALLNYYENIKEHNQKECAQYLKNAQPYSLGCICVRKQKRKKMLRNEYTCYSPDTWVDLTKIDLNQWNTTYFVHLWILENRLEIETWKRRLWVAPTGKNPVQKQIQSNPATRISFKGIRNHSFWKNVTSTA